jgi:hypothetical protein
MKTCCFCYPSYTKVISYADTRRTEGFLALLLDAHLLLQGDFFLTSRCNPPEMERVRKLRKMQLDEEA